MKKLIHVTKKDNIFTPDFPKSNKTIVSDLKETLFWTKIAYLEKFISTFQSYNSKIDIFRWLIKLTWDFHVRNKDGYTVIEVALQCWQESLAKELWEIILEYKSLSNRNIVKLKKYK